MQPRGAVTRWLCSCLLFGLILVFAARPAGAQVDMTGPWFARIFVLFFDVIECPLDFVQTGMMLSVTGDCPLVGNVTVTGTIDPLTGDFEGSGFAGSLCPTITLTGGTASLDGTTFHVGFQCSGGPLPAIGGIDGFRCGNGVLDASIGEVCDDGNHQSGDCCSNTCQYEPAGRFCFPTDANFCTDDVCDGAGTCIHVNNNTIPCDDGNQCTTGDHCQDGDCVTTPLPDGSPCTDFNDCTSESCQGAVCVATALPDGTPCDDGLDCYVGETCLSGQCQVGDPRVCPACTRCFEGAGCEVVIGYPYEYAVRDALRLDHDAPDSANWKWEPYNATALTDFGDPLTSTGYEFCVVDYDGINAEGFPRLLFSAALPAGSGWRQTHSGFYFRSPDKKLRVRVKTGAGGGQAKVLLRATGPAYNVEYLPPVDLVQAALQMSEGLNPARCFLSYFSPPLTSTPKKYKGQNPIP